MEANEVRTELNRISEQDYERHTGGVSNSLEGLMEAVVEEGTFTPDVNVTADLNLTLRERITGEREQDMTAMLMLGMMLGSALERDIPMDSEEEDAWREQEFTLPE